MPHQHPVMELRSISLSVEDRGDQYPDKKPVVDEFGQRYLGDFEGKIKSFDLLQKEWDAESVSVKYYNCSK